MRGEHWSFFHRNPASHTDQTRLQVLETQRRGRKGGKVWRKELMRLIFERGQGGREGGGGNDKDRRDRK